MHCYLALPGLFHEAIGRKGGEATKTKYGPEFYEAIGRKGEAATKQNMGLSFTS
jgi:general stress protein YciG